MVIRAITTILFGVMVAVIMDNNQIDEISLINKIIIRIILKLVLILFIKFKIHFFFKLTF